MKGRLFFLILFAILTVALSAQTIGLALGGGAARGLAHIGVLKAFEENGIPIDYVAGTSMGAIVGGLWASGYTAAEIESIFTKNDILMWMTSEPIQKRKPLNYLINRSHNLIRLGFRGWRIKLPESTVEDRILNFKLFDFFTEIDNAINGDFRKMWRPFLCTASDLNGERSVIFTSGKLEDAVRASMSIPLIFTPQHLDSTVLVDGGMYDNLPTGALKDTFNADYIISVDVSSNDKQFNQNFSILDIGFKIVDILTRSANADSIREFGYYMKPPVGDFQGFEFNRAQELIDIGYNEAMKHIDSIKAETGRDTVYSKNDNRKTQIKNYRPFRDLFIDKININAENRFQKIFILNETGLKKGIKLSMTEIEEGIYRLYATELFDRIEIEIKSDTVLNKADITFNTSSKQTQHIGIGGSSVSRMGTNVFLKYDNVNLFKYGAIFDFFVFVGESKSGFTANLVFPTLAYTPYFISWDNNIISRRMVSVYSKWYENFNDRDFLLHSGYNYDRNSFISIVGGMKDKKYGFINFQKMFLSLYHLQNTIPVTNICCDGERFNTAISVNYPRADSVKTYFQHNSYKNLYVKFISENIVQRSIGSDMGIEFTQGINYLTQIFSDGELPSSVLADYPWFIPAESFASVYEPELISRLNVSAGTELRFLFNASTYASAFIKGAVLTASVREFTPNYIMNYGFSIGTRNILGKMQIGFDVTYISAKPEGMVYSFLVHVGDAAEEIDILSKL